MVDRVRPGHHSALWRPRHGPGPVAGAPSVRDGLPRLRRPVTAEAASRRRQGVSRGDGHARCLAQRDPAPRWHVRRCGAGHRVVVRTGLQRACPRAAPAGLVPCVLTGTQRVRPPAARYGVLLEALEHRPRRWSRGWRSPLPAVGARRRERGADGADRLGDPARVAQVLTERGVARCRPRSPPPAVAERCCAGPTASGCSRPAAVGETARRGVESTRSGRPSPGSPGAEGRGDLDADGPRRLDTTTTPSQVATVPQQLVGVPGLLCPRL